MALIVDDYKTNENENNLTPPRGAPENMPPSQVNNTMRRMMAAIREVYEYAKGAIGNLGTMANQNASNVNIGGGNVVVGNMGVPNSFSANQDGTFILGRALPVAYGGTGVATLGQLFAAMGLQGHAQLSEYALARKIIPYGAIIPFTGGEGSLGPYFAICDGRTVTNPNGGQTTTPDLRGRFIVGAHPNTPAHSVGGPDPGSGGLFSVGTSYAGDHDHGGGTTGTALTVGQMPRHGHASVFLPGGDNVLANRNNIGSTNNYIAANGERASPVMLTGETGNGEAHAHGIPLHGGHTHTLTFSMRPPFYALAYAMAI
jgi:hypothetical protein